MSKYDDVQRFKDKINMKNIDYKEFPREDIASTLQRWPIVEQVAGSDSNHNATLEPTLPNATDFSAAAAAAASLAGQQQFQPAAAINENKPVADHISHQFEHLAPVAAPKPNNPPAQQAAPVFASQENRFNSSSVAPQTDVKRFKSMFSKKTSSSGEMDTGRNTLLKPLLESIASCR